MGGSLAKNVADISASSIASVFNSATLNCRASVRQNQSIQFRNVNGELIVIRNIRWNQVVTIDRDCFQKTLVSNEIDNQLDLQARQVANSIVESLGVGAAKSENIITIVTQLKTSVKNEFVTNCNTEVLQKQLLQFVDTNVGTICVGYLNWNQTFNSAVKCVQDSAVVNGVKQRLAVAIEQEAIAKVEGLLGPLLSILIIALIIIGVIVFGGVKMLTNWKVLLIIAALIILYIVIAFFRSWFPFD